MPDLWMDVDTALSEVPINKTALIDDTDFKTREESVAYNQAGLDLTWNFVTTAGVFTQTAVTPTESAGNYDWSNQGNGQYAIEIPASGGASINNDTEGFGWFSGVATGILPWTGPVIGFRAAALNDAYIDGGDVPDVNVTQFGGTSGTFSGGRPEVNTTLIEGSDATDQIRDAIVDDAQRLDGSALNTLAGHDPGETIMGATDLDATLAAIAGYIDTEIASIISSLSSLSTAVADVPTNSELTTALSGLATAAKLLAYVQSLARKDVTADSDIGGNFSSATDSQEAIRDRGDAAWTGGGAGGDVVFSPVLTEILPRFQDWSATLYVNDTGPVQLSVYDANHDAVDLTAYGDMTLSVEDGRKAEVQTVTDIASTISGADSNILTYTPNAAAVSTVRTLQVALRKTSNNLVVVAGTFQVKYLPS